MKSVTSLTGYYAVELGAPMYTGIIRIRDVKEFIDQLVTVFGPIRLIAVTMFAGKLDAGKMNFFERSLTSLLKVPIGDFRDWDAIAAWARIQPDKLGV
ncbi:MAG: hypothetical protein M0Q91_01220 [Methanoregula sp.]|jgi:menaquinone-dependent protoporphyrinogen oxidase|nr:hypothetical protein [Methanoregula sp.]